MLDVFYYAFLTLRPSIIFGCIYRKGKERKKKEKKIYILDVGGKEKEYIFLLVWFTNLRK